MVAQIPATLHNIADTVGLLVSLPLLGAVVKGVLYINEIKNVAKETNDQLEDALSNITRLLNDHETRLRPLERHDAIVWNDYTKRGIVKGD